MTSQLLQGRVTDASGATPGGIVHVHRFSLRAGSRVVRLKARADGTFEVPVGIPAVILASSTLGGAAASPATGYEPNYALQLRPRVEIRGRLRNAQGAPMEGARVSQVYVMKFTDKLVFVTPPNDQGRVQKRGRAFVAPCYCVSSVATTDAEGLFRLFALPPVDGKILLRMESPAAASFWVSATEFSDTVVRPEKGRTLRLPDGTPLDEIPLEPLDPAVEDEPMPEITDPQEKRRLWISRLAEECARNPRPELLPDLAAALYDLEDGVRVRAVDALSRLAPIAACRKRAVEMLKHVVEEGDACVNVALTAAAALVELGESDRAGPFYEALRRDDADERIAARALAHLLRRDAIELILSRMAESEYPVELGSALETLTGAHHGDRVALWKDWFETKRDTLPRQAPKGDDPSFARARERYQRKDIRGAKADLDAILRRDGPSAPALALRARIRMGEGDLEGALRDADHALRLNPREAAVRSLREAIVGRQAAGLAATSGSEIRNPKSEIRTG